MFQGMLAHGSDGSLFFAHDLFEFLIKAAKGRGILLVKGRKLIGGQLLQLFQELFHLGDEPGIVGTLLH